MVLPIAALSELKQPVPQVPVISPQRFLPALPKLFRSQIDRSVNLGEIQNCELPLIMTLRKGAKRFLVDAPQAEYLMNKTKVVILQDGKEEFSVIEKVLFIQERVPTAYEVGPQQKSRNATLYRAASEKKTATVFTPRYDCGWIRQSIAPDPRPADLV